MKMMQLSLAFGALVRTQPLFCEHICASHHKKADLESSGDKDADFWMTVHQDQFDLMQQDKSVLAKSTSMLLNGRLRKAGQVPINDKPLDMGVTAAQCACAGITKITATTGRELGEDEELNGRLLECDQKEADCKACCSGDPAYRGCKIDQGEEACSNSCDMDHKKCENDAKNWESR